MISLSTAVVYWTSHDLSNDDSIILAENFLIALLSGVLTKPLGTTKQTNYPRRHPADKQEAFRTERWCHFQEMYTIFFVVLFRP